MGQSVVDLPDPVGRGGARAAGGEDELVVAPAGGGGNADDLLAQLAGEEVDRLLAEAREDAGAGAGGPEQTNMDRRYPPASASLPAVEILPEGEGLAQAGLAAKAAGIGFGVDPKDAALDDLFKQLSTEPLPIPMPSSAAGAVAAASGLDREERGDVLEQSLTARAQELIDAAQREAEADLALAASGPQAQAERAAFDAASGRDGVAASVEHGLTVSPPIDRAGGGGGATAGVAGGAVAEPASVAAALAEEMEQDERVHAGAVAKLAIAKDAVEASSNAGKTSGLSVTGIAVIGDEVEEEPRAAAVAAAPAAVVARAAAGVGPMTGGAASVVAAGPVVYDDAEDREPFLVRFLEWLNAPLENLSDSARAAIGRIAITTMVNALAILVYVLVFRRSGQ